MSDSKEATTPARVPHGDTLVQSGVPTTELPDVPRPIITQPPDGARNVRGFEILNTLAFARDRAGRSGMVGSLRRLGATDLARLTGGAAEDRRRIHRLEWVPYGLHCRLLRAVDAELGDGDLSQLFNIGTFMAERDLPTLFRPLLKLGRPGWVVDAGTKMWGIYHHEGRWELERSPGELIARLEDLTDVDEAYCLTFLGWISRGMELTGAVDVEAHHPVCMARGGSSCVFTGRWG